MVFVLDAIQHPFVLLACQGQQSFAGPEAFPRASGRVLVLVHGLCMSDLQWERNGHDHGATLARDPAIAPANPALYLHYNSGLHVSINGREFSALLEALVQAWPVPVEEISFLTHSMGGLVTRSAFHYGMAAGHRWPGRVARIVFLGAPHDGAPLERGGNWVDAVLDASPYTAAFARLGKLRSAGITDLRHGSLVDEDWGGKDRFARSTGAAVKRHFVPLPAGVKCFAVAAALAKKAAPLGDGLVGDGLVPVPSALARGRTPGAALGRDSRADVSADGREAVFVSSAQGNLDVYAVNLETREVRPVVQGGTSSRWMHAGRRAGRR